MADRKIRVGVIGVGFGTAVQIPGFQSEEVEVMAVCSRRPERAAQAAQEFGIPHVFSDYRDMLQLDQLDAVSIVTPPDLHHPMTLDSLRAGKHVMCEKPMAMDQQQAREMLETAQQTGLTTMITHEFRFAPARALVKELLGQGYLGTLHLVNLSLFLWQGESFKPRPMLWQSDASQGGGFLFALGSHYIDCLRTWFGEITTASGWVATLFPDRVLPNSADIVHASSDDTFSFTVTLQKGGWATMTASLAAAFGPDACIQLYGSEGTLITPQPSHNPIPEGVVLGARSGDQELAEIPMPQRLRPLVDDRDHRLFSFRMLVREFVRGIQSGASPPPNFYDGYRCQQVLDAILESFRTGRRIDVPPA